MKRSLEMSSVDRRTRVVVKAPEDDEATKGIEGVRVENVWLGRDDLRSIEGGGEGMATI